MASTSATDSTTGPATSTSTGGESDIHYHARVFRGFVRFLTWGGGLAIAALIFTALVNA